MSALILINESLPNKSCLSDHNRLISSYLKETKAYVKLHGYPSGPNNSVVLNKRVGLIFCSPFTGENECLWENFKSY